MVTQHIAVILQMYCARLNLPLGLLYKMCEWKTWSKKHLNLRGYG